VTTRQVQVVPGGPARHSCVVNLSLVDRCAQFARAQTLDPSGTAGSYRGYVAIDVPLPWPNDIAEHPTVAPVAGALASAGVRVQGTVPDPSDGEGSRMVTFLRPPGPFVAYEAATWRLDPGDATAALAAIAASATAGGALDGGPATLVAEGDAAGRLVLVCTHGSRDACCGSLGTRLARSLPGLGPGVQVRRTSHTGGHRFAPTALLLPEGTAWAYLDMDTLVAIADRTLDPELAARTYRGCTGLEGPEVQAVDGAALREVGWAWLDHRRSGTVVERDGDRSLVRLEGEDPDGRRRAFEATVEVARVVPVPDCGKPIDQARKSAPELRVRDLRAV
jgi:hypothetical protein